MAKLVLSSGGSVVNQYFIDKDRITIGRDSDSDIAIDDPAVSREHAVIVTVGNDQIVEDLQSSNGTFVNGSQVSRQILQHRDVLEFGAFSLCYLNSKASADMDFERTMLIAGLARPDGEAPVGKRLGPAARPSGIAWPSARVHYLGGADASRTRELNRVVAVFGTPGDQTAVITRRPHGYTVSRVEGRPPSVNGQTLTADGRLLRPGDVIEVGSEKLEFQQDVAAG